MSDKKVKFDGSNDDSSKKFKFLTKSRISRRFQRGTALADTTSDEQTIGDGVDGGKRATSSRGANVDGGKVVGGATTTIGTELVRSLPFEDNAQLSRILQTQLFAKDTEELYSVSRVLKLDKTKKANKQKGKSAESFAPPSKQNKDKPPKESLLCITEKRGKRVRLQHVVYKYQKGKFVIDQTWRLDDLSRYDPVDEPNGNAIVALEFNSGKDKTKTVSFLTCNAEQRNDFFWLLIQQCREKLTEQPLTSLDVLEVQLLAAGNTQPDGETVVGTEIVPENVSLLPATAEKELQELLASQHIGVGDVGELVPRLRTQLDNFESSTITGLVDGAPAASELKNAVVEARRRVGAVDAWLNDHNQQLNHMLTYIAQIEAKNNRMEVTARNQLKLLDAVDSLLAALTLSKNTRATLEQPDLASGSGLARATKAAHALAKLLERQENLDEWQQGLRAVRERRAECGKLRDAFASEAGKQIGKIVSAGADERDEGKSKRLTWQPTTSLYASLEPYSPLAHWLADMDTQAFALVRAGYQRAAARLTHRNARNYFADVRHAVRRERTDHRLASFGAGSSLQPALSRRGSVEMSAQPSSSSASAMPADEAFAMALSVVVNIVLAEQSFCAKFFKLSHAVATSSPLKRHASTASASSSNHSTLSRHTSMSGHSPALTGRFAGRRIAVGLAATGVAAARASLTELAKKSAEASERERENNTKSTASGDNTPNNDDAEASSSVADAQRKVLEDVPSELELMIAPTFEPVEDELRAIIELADRADNFYVLGILVHCERLAKRHALTPAELCGGPCRTTASAYLAHLLGALQRSTVQLFNKFIDDQCEWIRSSKEPNKKSDVMPCFKRFPLFVEHMEAVLAAARAQVGGEESSESMSLADAAHAHNAVEQSLLKGVVSNAYHKLAVTMFRWLESLQLDGKQKHLVRIENYDYFATQIGARVKNARALRSYVAQATNRVEQYTREFSDYLLRKEFSAFVDFFNGVQALLDGGLPPDEVQYQSVHSKPALAKLVGKLAALEKGIARVRERLDDHVSDATLRTRLWQAFSEHFIARCRTAASLVKQCYKSTPPPLDEEQLKAALKKHDK